jgi:hypothetical protein
MEELGRSWRRGDSKGPVDRYIVVDAHQFDEERDRTRIKVKRGIRIRITVMQFCYLAKMDQ